MGKLARQSRSRFMRYKTADINMNSRGDGCGRWGNEEGDLGSFISDCAHGLSLGTGSHMGANGSAAPSG